MDISIEKANKIGVAVSGGADSMVMLYLLKRKGIDIVAINVDHSIRGEESENDSLFVKNYCENNEIPILSYKIDALKYALDNKISIELGAREARYAIFDDLLKNHIVDKIALAHHADDQFETMLLRFMRGTGVRGLRGIVDRDGYIHPMIKYSKKEILDFAVKNDIPFVIDATNNDTEYRRNFFRVEIIPKIKELYPDVLNVMTKMSDIFYENEDYLLSEITPHAKYDNYVELPVSVLNRHKAIAKKSIAEAIRSLGIYKDIEYNHLENILDLKDKPNNTEIDLPFNLKAVKEYDSLKIYLSNNDIFISQLFDISNEYCYKGKRYTFSKTNDIIKGLSFDLNKMPIDAIIRQRLKGDTFKRCNGKRKSLSDYLTDKKIPKTERDEILVIAKDNEIYLIVGYEISDYVKIDQNTKNIITINIGGC